MATAPRLQWLSQSQVGGKFGPWKCGLAALQSTTNAVTVTVTVTTTMATPWQENAF